MLTLYTMFVNPALVKKQSIMVFIDRIFTRNVAKIANVQGVSLQYNSNRFYQGSANYESRRLLLRTYIYRLISKRSRDN